MTFYLTLFFSQAYSLPRTSGQRHLITLRNPPLEVSDDSTSSNIGIIKIHTSLDKTGQKLERPQKKAAVLHIYRIAQFRFQQPLYYKVSFKGMGENCSVFQTLNFSSILE